MIRKQTWILLFIFAALTGFAYYLQKNPPSQSAELTPSPTSQSPLLEGWTAENMKGISYKDSNGTEFSVEKSDTGEWFYLPDGESVSPGKINELIAEITSAKSMTSMDSSYDLTALGLQSPDKIISLTQLNGASIDIRIGQMTPTNSGYYVQVDLNAPTVVSRGAIDSILDLLKKEVLLEITPTPVESLTPAADSPMP